MSEAPSPDHTEDAPTPADPPSVADNPPPPAAPPESALMNVIGSIEHLLAGFKHATQVLPALGGIGMVVASAERRLNLAKTAIVDAEQIATSLDNGDGLLKVGEDADAALVAGEQVFAPFANTISGGEPPT